MPQIRTNYFNRTKFNNLVLADWCARTGRKVIRVVYLKTRVKVLFKGGEK